MSTETAAHQAARRAADRPAAEGARRRRKLFTLSGGHLFSIYDGCREEGIDLVDVRHESTAAFAAEGWAKVTREPGVAALTAGPGRDQRDERDRLGAAEPLADGRARRPRARVALGPGLAAGDRPRAVRAPADQARRDAGGDRGDPGPGRRGVRAPRSRRTRGPAFVDFPLDVVFMEARGARSPSAAAPARPRAAPPTGARSSAPRRCCARPSGR